MKCDKCGSETTSSVGDHPYVEAGLPHVVLRNVETRTCSRCGESAVALPALSALHRSLAFEISHQLRFLLGSEVQFLRKVMDLSLEQLASTLSTGVAFQTEWEAHGINPAHDRDTNISADRLIRLYLQHHFKVDDKWPGFFRDIKQTSEVKTRIEAVFQDGAWAMRTVPLS